MTHPHSSECERAILGALLLEPSLLEQTHLTDSDFYLERNRLIWRAIIELGREDRRIDLRTVQAELERQGRIDHVGGLAYLAGLDVDLPDLNGFGEYARILRDLGRRRTVAEIATQMGQSVGGSEAETGELVAKFRRSLEQLEATPGLAGWAPARQRVETLTAQLRKRWETRRESGKSIMGLETGLSRLDNGLGGLQRGVYLLAGGPGVGKTSLALQMAVRVAERQVPVVYLTFENSAENLLLKALCPRIPRNGSPWTVQRVLRGEVAPENLEEAFSEMEALDRLYLEDGNGSWTVGDLRVSARRAMREHQAERCLVVVDYLQLWAKISRELRSLGDVRSKVDTLCGELIDLTRSLDSPVVALASQSRAGGRYSGKGEAALDSFKESGDLEYSADAALFLTEAREREVPAPLRAVDLTIKKNRNGASDWRDELVFDPQLGIFNELETRFG